MNNNNKEVPIYQKGRHKGKLIQAELQVEGVFCAGDPHPVYETLVFAYAANGKQTWTTQSGLEARKKVNNKAASKCYYAKFPDEMLTPYGQVRREMKREGIKRVPQDEFERRMNEAKASRGADYEPKEFRNHQYQTINTNSTEYLLAYAEQNNRRIKREAELRDALCKVARKAEADLVEEIGSDNWRDLVKAGLNERTKAAESEFLVSYNRLHNQ